MNNLKKYSSKGKRFLEGGIIEYEIGGIIHEEFKMGTANGMYRNE